MAHPPPQLAPQRGVEPQRGLTDVTEHGRDAGTELAELETERGATLPGPDHRQHPHLRIRCQEVAHGRSPDEAGGAGDQDGAG